MFLVFLSPSWDSLYFNHILCCLVEVLLHLLVFSFEIMDMQDALLCLPILS